jgi:hypothetical protein
MTFFSSLCMAVALAACGVMWGFGVFSGVSAGAVVGTVVGILLATLIGTALMALAVYSSQSGHDEAIFRVEKEPESTRNP